MKAVVTVIVALSEKMIVPFRTAIPANLGVLWSTNKVMPAGTKTRSLSIGGRSTPQVLSSLHFSTYRNWAFSIALLPSRVTEKLFLAGRLGLAPAWQIIWLLLLLMCKQKISSILIITLLANPKLLPVSVTLYPPKMSPYYGLTEVTIGVRSDLKYRNEDKLKEL